MFLHMHIWRDIVRVWCILTGISCDGAGGLTLLANWERQGVAFQRGSLTEEFSGRV